MNIHYFQHVAFEGLGYIEEWANQNEHSLTVTKFFEEYSLPDINTVDWLIVLGGPMGVYDEKQYPWLIEEKEYIKQCIALDKKVLGICLGSQLIAEVLGAKVHQNPDKEIGWFPVRKTQQGQEYPLLHGINLSAPVFHWHGDTFTLPPGAVHLLESEACKNQAYVYNDKVLGLQFHLEVTPQNLLHMVISCGNELLPPPFIQSAEAILDNEGLSRLSNKIFKELLNRFSK